MAEPLLSLMTPGTMKHVVPWKTRSDFLAVYQDLYSSDISCQETAIGKIAMWKSRAGSKLSVAIESSGALMQARIDHIQARRDGKLLRLEHQLRNNYSLALIRFINHVTEKAQTKAVAQPVHLVAREFGIPEWVVRLRHEATHGALPCLDALATGTKWALDYLEQNFWERQRTTSSESEGHKDDDVDEISTDPGQSPDKLLKTSDICKALNDFQTIRYKKKKSTTEDKSNTEQTAVLARLQKYLTQDRLRFIECLLKDGMLIANEEQLHSFGIDSYVLKDKLPPSIPQPLALFWRPLLKRLNNVGALSFFLHAVMFSVTSEHSLHNYQLVAWIALILSNTSITAGNPKGRRRRQKKHDCFMRISQAIPTKVLLSACIKNLNKLTVHLLKYLVDPESLGEEIHNKLMRLLDVTHNSHSPEKDIPAADVTTEPDDDSDSVSSESDSDAMSTLPAEKSLRTAKMQDNSNISTSTLEEIKRCLNQDHVPWILCKDPVDWSSVPLGLLPDHIANKSGDVLSDEDVQSPGGLETKVNPRCHSRKGRRGDTDRYREEDDDDEDESDDAEYETNPKRSKLVITEEPLI